MENIADLHEQVYAHLTTKYPDLTFSLRKINNSEKLEQGYWFYGSQWYLRLSFWEVWTEGSHQLTLNITIFLDNTVWVDFQPHQDAKVRDFKDKMVGILGLEPYDGYGSSHKCISKPEDLGDMTKALDRFIRQDRIIIDTFIKNENMSDIFTPFDQKNFLHYKSRIEEYRKNLSYKDKVFTEKYDYKPIKINNTTLENITCIAPTEIIFHSRLTCFIGANGSGKTTILRAIALGLVGVDLVKSVILDKMVNISMGENRNIVYAETATIQSEFDTKKQSLISFSSEDRTKVAILPSDNTPLVANENYLYTLVLAFAQERGGKTVEKDISIKKDKPNIYDFLSLIKNDTDSRFDDVAEWIFDIYNDNLNQNNPTGELKPTRNEAFDLIFDIISTITDQKISVKTTKYEGRLVWLDTNGRTELLGLKSQGFENLFVWIGVLVKRLYEIQPNTPYKKLTDIPAIVLIDEIDTYLHISVQQKILAVLVEKFPNIQFIVTTHSPYTIGSIPNDKIKIYVCKKEGESVEVEAFNDFTPYGANIERLSRRIFGTKERTEGVGELLETINKLIGCNDYVAAIPYIDVIKTQLQDFNHFINENQSNIMQTDVLIIAEKAIDILKKITDKDDPDLFAMQSFINTKRRLRNRRAHETH